MQSFIPIALVTIISALGCASQSAPATKAAQHPIIGTWVLNTRETDPAAARGIESTIKFLPGGAYASTARAGPDKPTIVGDGTYRIQGDDVYLDTGSGPQRLDYQIAGSHLILHDHGDPGAMIFDRQSP